MSKICAVGTDSFVGHGLIPREYLDVAKAASELPNLV
jgi:hypothetical protein